MSERFLGGSDAPRERRESRDEYFDLLSRASQGVDALSLQERERLVAFGYHYLDVEKNMYEATHSFERAQNFEGLRKVADQLLRERPDSYELPHVLTLLEDYEGMRNLLNSETASRHFTYPRAFRPLKGHLWKHMQKFLDENGTPIATGIVTPEIDIVAIRNLAHQYDVAVPIARGGLKQGAIASLWMPTRIIDIAAHNRTVPESEWVNPVSPEDFAGKRVLLFDKDAVTGASIREAIKMLAPFHPAAIDVYFAHDVGPGGHTKTEGLPTGLNIFYPNNAPLEKAGDAYIEAHEKLGTQYGRRRQIESLFTGEIQNIKEQYPDLSESLEEFASQQLHAFDSLNQLLPGISEVREKILQRLHGIYETHQEYLKSDMYNLFPGVLDNFKQLLSATEPLPVTFEEELVRARYKEQTEEVAQSRNIENPHYPSDSLAAFDAAYAAVKQGFDVALIVGPEGFAYEPYFLDLGLPTVAVNIPESGEGEARTITALDDLSTLQGKKVLVVEDDVRTGATLQKLIEHLESNMPAHLGLYLGQRESFQKTTNIPQAFAETFTAGVDTDPALAGQNFREYLESKGLKCFK